MQLEPCCICKDKEPIFRCVQCQECLICIGCVQNLMEHGLASRCPICRKTDDWCMPIVKANQNRITICQCIYNIISCKNISIKCPRKKDIYDEFINWKIDHQNEIKIAYKFLALIGILCVFYLIGIGWAKLYNGCITTCKTFYQNTLEHIFRGAFISFIVILGSLLISRICYDCYKQNILCGCVINICICITCIFKSIFTYTIHLILKCCNKPLKIQIENN